MATWADVTDLEKFRRENKDEDRTVRRCADTDGFSIKLRWRR